jgi:hypothetical protein
MKKKLYLCGIDFQHELGEACGGTKLYPSVEDLKENQGCWTSCGIIELEIDTKKHKWVEPQDLWNSEGTVTSEEIKTLEYKKRRLKHWQQAVEEQIETVKRFERIVETIQKEIEEYE